MCKQPTCPVTSAAGAAMNRPLGLHLRVGSLWDGGDGGIACHGTFDIVPFRPNLTEGAICHDGWCWWWRWVWPPFRLENGDTHPFFGLIKLCSSVSPMCSRSDRVGVWSWSPTSSTRLAVCLFIPSTYNQTTSMTYMIIRLYDINWCYDIFIY
jgi:hypothetical protein